MISVERREQFIYKVSGCLWLLRHLTGFITLLSADHISNYLHFTICSIETFICNHFLAHLSTKCSVSFCDPSMSGVRCPSSVRASFRPSTISLNNISSETAYWILTKLHRNDPWVVPYQSCSNCSSWLHK